MRIAIALFILAGAAGCGTTIRAGEVGVKYNALSEPALQKDVKPEGFYWQWPWNDIVRYVVTWQSKTEDVDILTADDLHVATKVTVTYRPQRAQIYRVATEIGPGYYEQVIRPAFLTLARSEFSRHRHDNLAKDGPAIEAEVLVQLRAAVTGKPVDIDRVAISHIEFDRNLTAAISQKLASAQKVDQKEFELKIAERDADIARATARGRADAVRIEAEGRAAAIVIEGEAQGKAQAEITKTLTASYLRYKAFDSDATKYYFVPVGKDGMPIIIGTDATAIARPISVGATRSARSPRRPAAP
jgi:regulator of protease activity HflC (stomatin/prohibitin superfamily)